MPSLTLKLNGLKHRIETWGASKKPKLFLVHGWMEMGKSFEFLCRHLKQDFFCIAPDMRGFGHSEHSKDPLGYRFFNFLADLHALIEHFSSQESIRLFGHSMGGNIASLYAGTFPDRVSHFVNVEGFGITDMRPELGPKRVLQWLNSVQNPPHFRSYKTLKDLAQRFRETNPRLDEKRALFLAQHMSVKTKTGYKISSDPKHKMPNPELFQLQNMSAFWKKIQARCLLVMGEETELGTWLKSEMGLEEALKERFSYFPANSQEVVIPKVGHMIHHERPDLLAKAVLPFLRSDS